MRAINIAILIVALCGNAALAETVGGKYTVQGTNIDGSSYSGTRHDHPEQQLDLPHRLENRLDLERVSACSPERPLPQLMC